MGIDWSFVRNLGLFGDRWQMCTSAPKGVAFYFYILQTPKFHFPQKWNIRHKALICLLLVFPYFMHVSIVHFCLFLWNIIWSIASIMAKRTTTYLEWDKVVLLIKKLEKDENYKFMLLISLGTFLGLRISDSSLIINLFSHTLNFLHKDFFSSSSML